MSQDAPIYQRLIAERGDIPAQAREAERTLRNLGHIMRPGTPSPGIPEHMRPGTFG